MRNSARTPLRRVAWRGGICAGHHRRLRQPFGDPSFGPANATGAVPAEKAGGRRAYDSQVDVRVDIERSNGSIATNGSSRAVV